MIKYGGRQVLGEYKCSNLNLLKNGERLEEILVKSAKKHGYTVKTKLYKFTPYGITAIAVLGESHVIIHTYPDYNHLSLDCYTCFGDPNRIVKDLERELNLTPLEVTEYKRGKKITEKPKWILDNSSTDGVAIKYYIEKYFFNKRSQYQQIDIIKHQFFGKMLFLDKSVQISERDADIYNKSIVQPIIERGETLGNVLILGGGDGGVANVLLKNNLAQNIILVDIDKEVIEACKKFMPEVWGCALDNPRVNIVIEDAFKYLKHASEKFDAIIYDLTSHPEQVGMKIDQKRFLRSVFADCKRILNDNGIFTMQCCEKDDKKTFTLVKSLLGKYFKNISFSHPFIPSYYDEWVFAYAQK